MTDLSDSFDAERINRAATEKMQLFLAELGKSPHHEFALRYWYAIAYTRACGKIYQDKVLGLFQLAQDSAKHHLEVLRSVPQQIDESTKMAEELMQALANRCHNEDAVLQEQRKMNLRLITTVVRQQEQMVKTGRVMQETEASILGFAISYWDFTLRYVLESSTVEDFSKSILERLSGLASAVNPVYSLLASLWSMVKPPKSILQTEASSAALEYLDGYINDLNRYAVTAIVSDAAAMEEADESVIEEAIDDCQPEVDALVKSYLPQDLFGRQQ